MSNHSPILLQLAIPPSAGWERRWSFPSSALLDKVFRAEIQETIAEYFTLNTGTVPHYSTLWDAFKAYICGIIISKQAGLLRSIRRDLAKTEASLAELDESSPDPLVQTRRNTLLMEFNEQVDREASLLGKYQQAQRYGEGKRLSRTLARLVNPSQDAGRISSIHRPDGSVVTADSAIMSEMVDYYSSLYKTTLPAKSNQHLTYLQETAMVYLDRVQTEFLAAPFSVEEIPRLLIPSRETRLLGWMA